MLSCVSQRSLAIYFPIGVKFLMKKFEPIMFINTLGECVRCFAFDVGRVQTKTTKKDVGRREHFGSHMHSSVFVVGSESKVLEALFTAEMAKEVCFLLSHVVELQQTFVRERLNGVLVTVCVC